MLQQTRVATVLPYFERWMGRFPTVEALSAATRDDVLSHWQGLGYYRRAIRLWEGARQIVRTGLPRSFREWRNVPGVGTYTAGAIASIALGEASPAVDGNVRRVYARFHRSSLKGQALESAARSWVASSVDPERPGDWNQALMELGALVCVPIHPLCSACPIGESCSGRDTATRPMASSSAKVDRVVVRTVAIYWAGGCVGLRRAETGEWWAGLWVLPETTDLPADKEPITVRQHTVTRHRVTTRAYLCSNVSDSVTWFLRDEVKDIPMAPTDRRILEEALSKLNLV